MSTARRFSKPVVAALDASKILGVRSGTAHRFTAVWVVVVDSRVFARPWDHSATSWYDAFLEEPLGTISAASVTISIPLIIAVLLFQKRIVAGLTAGAVKG